MTIERRLALAEALAATLDGRQERAQAVLEALALLKVYCVDLTTARAVAIAWALSDELRALRPTDAAIAQAVQELGIRGAARALNVPRTTVGRVAAKVRECPSGTPTALPSAQPARRVDALNELMGPGDVAAASFVHDRGVPTAATDKGDAMLGNGSKRRELVSPQVAIDTLLERVERLEKVPANAQEAAKQEAERLQIRARLVQERFALIDALARQGVALAGRVEKARHVLAHASGPAAQAAADGALRGVLQEQQSNSDSNGPALLAQKLINTADPRLRVWQREVESEIAECPCYEAPFVPYTRQERERIKREAEAAPVLDYGDDPRPSVPGVITIYPRLSGAPDQKIFDGIVRRKAALEALKLKLRDEWPLEPLTADEVTSRYESARASIPRIPDGASLVVPLPRTYTVDLTNILTRDLEPLIVADTSREAPRDMPPDGTVYVNGVPQL